MFKIHHKFDIIIPWMAFAPEHHWIIQTRMITQQLGWVIVERVKIEHEALLLGFVYRDRFLDRKHLLNLIMVPFACVP